MIPVGERALAWIDKYVRKRICNCSAEPMTVPCSSADRGWIRRDMNQIERGKRESVRVPPGKEMAHELGREAAKRYSYQRSNLQTKADPRPSTSTTDTDEEQGAKARRGEAVMAGRKIHPEEIKAVLALDGPARYEHFIKQVADRNAAWGLWADGWAMGADDQGIQTFPLWPLREYAELCATNEWFEFRPEEIPLDDLIDDLLPKLAADRVQPSVFRTPGGNSVLPAISQLIDDLRAEKARYE